METAIWTPSFSRIENSNLTRYLSFLHTEYHCLFDSYNGLYQWSIQEPEKFWLSISEFCNVLFTRQWNDILTDPEKMPGASWFAGSQLNFAQNLLWNKNEKDAIAFTSENGDKKTVSYRKLNQDVASLAHALLALDLQKGDRIAGYLPNIPETIISMLSATAIGAVWSSCSPDFGVHGVLDRFGQIQPKVLITTDGYLYNGKQIDLLPRIKQLALELPGLQKVVIIPFLNSEPDISGIKNAVLLHNFIDQKCSNIPFKSVDFDHPLYIMYSSGTTGKPKCIVHGTGGTLLQHLKELILHTDLKQEDRIFYFTTCGWMMWNWLVSSLATGATVVLYDGSPFYPASNRLFDLIDEENISIFGSSAKFLSATQKAGLIPKESHSLSTLQTILSTGSSLLPEQYDYVYQSIKQDVLLSSISGGTDIISCFALGNPHLPVYRGEIQCRGLGMSVEVYNANGQSVEEQKGELVCNKPFPSMPVYFWNDSGNRKYQEAYFNKFPKVWAHGDYAELTQHSGIIIFGRSDTVLNPGGVRIGTAEIYRQVERIPEVLEGLVVGQEWQGDVRIILFTKLRENIVLDGELTQKIKDTIRANASPRHVPHKIIQVPDIPRTISGKTVELAVQNIIHGRPVKNADALANPESLEYFRNLPELHD